MPFVFTREALSSVFVQEHNTTSVAAEQHKGMANRSRWCFIALNPVAASGTTATNPGNNSHRPSTFRTGSYFFSKSYHSPRSQSTSSSSSCRLRMFFASVRFRVGRHAVVLLAVEPLVGRIGDDGDEPVAAAVPRQVRPLRARALGFAMERMAVDAVLLDQALPGSDTRQIARVGVDLRFQLRLGGKR